MKQLNRRSLPLLAALALVGCGDDPVSPANEGSNQVPDALLPVAEEFLDALQGASRDALEWTRRAIGQADARAKLERGLEVLSGRLAARDARGVERALGDTRSALVRYRATLPKESGDLPDAEAISLMLDAIEAAVASDPASSGPERN